jgi:UDP-N-acetylmuramate--alanine ligase
MFRGTVRTIHFVGIGGIGMSGIAEVMLNLGFRVTGSDLKAGVAVQRLRALGAEVLLGHVTGNIGDADVVVYSSAVKADNPELVEAIGRGTPVIQRAEMLAELMRLKHGIAIAGTHGKTTTTSMVAACLAAGGLDPTVVIGGRLDSLGGTNAKLGSGEYLVAEADESDGTFLLLSPTIALITNIDPEHLDHWGEFSRTVDAFESFANKVPFFGFSVLCIDHPQVAALLPKVRRRVVTYGMARHAHYRASHVERDGLRTAFRVHRGDDELGTIRLAMPGVHNVSNAIGAIALSCELGVPFDAVQRALDGFSGVQRRFTVVGEKAGVMVVDDYGHHPVEIEATLAAAEGGFPDRRIIAVFQPHRYSRVASLWTEFCSAFHRADVVLVCPVYAAGEAPLEGIDATRIAAEMRDRGHRGAEVVANLDDATARLAAMVRPGDIVISLGAGDVNRVCGELLTRLGDPA